MFYFEFDNLLDIGNYRLHKRCNWDEDTPNIIKNKGTFYCITEKSDNTKSITMGVVDDTFYAAFDDKLHNIQNYYFVTKSGWSRSLIYDKETDNFEVLYGLSKLLESKKLELAQLNNTITKNESEIEFYKPYYQKITNELFAQNTI